MTSPASPASPDPVLARRERIARWVAIGQRVGYSLLAFAVVAFVVGYGIGFNGPLVATIVVALVVSSVVLVPAIIFGYGVRAAEREEREERQRHVSRDRASGGDPH